MGRTRTMGTNGKSTVSVGDTVRSSATTVYSRTPRYASLINSYKECYDEVHKRPYAKNGGPLSIRSIDASYSPAHSMSGSMHSWAAQTQYDYDRYCMFYPNRVTELPADDLDNTRSLGPEAWERFSPNAEQVNLAQFLAELRDFPRLFQVSLKKFSDLGSGYLNYQFGWRPFLADVRTFLANLQKLDAQIARLKRQNGKWIRKGGTLYRDEEETQAPSLVYIHPNEGLTSVVPKCTVHTETRAWFSGSFRFYIPGLDDERWGRFRAARKIWGANITPALLWELLPWSWLIDWVTNIGSCLSNLSAVTSENMAARSAYVMRSVETSVNAKIAFTNVYKNNGVYSYTDHVSSSRIRTTTKARAVASPFGFNIDWPDFSSYQLSILTALGISRIK